MLSGNPPRRGGLEPLHGAKSKGAFFKGHRGFTLVELLVAMVLLSMVTLVVAMALKLSIESWEHGVEEGEDIQRWVAIPVSHGKTVGCPGKNRSLW